MARVNLSTGIVNLNLQQLRERSGQIWEVLQAKGKSFNERKAKADAGESVELWPGEEQAVWDATNADYDAICAGIEQEKRDAAVAARLVEVERQQAAAGGGHPSGGDAGADTRRFDPRAAEQRARDQSLCFRAWANQQTPGFSPDRETSEALERTAFNPRVPEITLRLLDTDAHQAMVRRIAGARPEHRSQVISEIREQRALSGAIGATGGYTLTPGTLVTSLELAMIEYGAMLQAAETITTATSDPIFWPVGDDTANTGAYTDENQANTTEANPAFEQVKWGSYDFNSKMVKVPFTLLRDTAINLESILGAMLGERLGRILSTECTTGVAKVRGIVTRAAKAGDTANATSIVREDIVELQHAIDPANRTNCSLMFHDNILAALRLIEDLNGLPIYQNNTRTGGIDTIEGWPFIINQNMASSTTTKYITLLGGQLNKYKIRRVGSVRLKRLEERYAEYDQIAFIAFMSADGNLLRPSQDAATAVKYMAQA
jgi:HK97 family phage major capsid protein